MLYERHIVTKPVAGRRPGTSCGSSKKSPFVPCAVTFTVLVAHKTCQNRCNDVFSLHSYNSLRCTFHKSAQNQLKLPRSNWDPNLVV